MPKSDLITPGPKSLVITARFDIRHVATIATYWTNLGLRPKTMAEIIQRSIEDITKMIVDTGDVPFVDTIEDAENVLFTYRILSSAKKEEHSNMVYRQLVKNHLPNRTTKSMVVPASPKATISPEQFARAQTALDQKLIESTTQRTAEAEARTQEFKDQLATKSPDA